MLQFPVPTVQRNPGLQVTECYLLPSQTHMFDGILHRDRDPQTQLSDEGESWVLTDELSHHIFQCEITKNRFSPLPLSNQKRGRSIRQWVFNQSTKLNVQASALGPMRSCQTLSHPRAYSIHTRF